MILYFGGMPDPIGTPLILFVLLSVIGYVRFHCRPSTLDSDAAPRGFRTCGSVRLARLRHRSDLPGSLCRDAASCRVAVDSCVRGGRLRAVCGLYAYITLATNSPWTWMLPLFARHTTLTDIPEFTLMQWFGNAIALNRMLHTLALMTACGLWVAILGFRIRRSQPGATVARLLIVWGGLCILIGNKAAYWHEFVWMFLTPGLAVSTALLIESLFRVTERYRVAPVMRISMAIAGAMFAGWTAYHTFQRLYPRTRAVPFTPIEMGEAIRAAAPDPGDLALVIGGDGGTGGPDVVLGAPCAPSSMCGRFRRSRSATASRNCGRSSLQFRRAALGCNGIGHRVSAHLGQRVRARARYTSKSGIPRCHSPQLCRKSLRSSR